MENGACQWRRSLAGTVSCRGSRGEFFVAAELLKRDIQTSVTFGSAKAIDLLAHNPRSGANFTIQVKALRTTNYFLLRRDHVDRSHTWVFVLLNRPGVPVRYFIVPGRELVDHPERFGKGYADPKMPGILPRDLIDFEDNWAEFGPLE